ncbi:MAG: ABC transporter permease [Alphaproteobacteria bacterium]|nr:ABC transporter permease [Alphaproteobacteria bacterium]
MSLTMPWFVRRVLGIVPTLFLTWTIVFGVLQLIPGDPVMLALGGTPASDEVLDNERRRLGLDQPVYIQYLTFLKKMAIGDLGNGYSSKQPVSEMIAARVRPSLELALGGLLVGILLGVALGIAAGLRPHGWIDTMTMSTALVGVSLPSFWIGMLLIYVFGLQLEWVPILGDGIDALILPSITIGLFLAGGLARLIRSALIETMTQDYIRTAHSKGLSAVRVVAKHAMRNAIIPPITLLGLQFAVLIGGAVVTERVFARAGLGSMLIDAVLTKDIPLVQGLVVYTTTAYIVINLLLELLYGIVDPRIRSRRA